MCAAAWFRLVEDCAVGLGHAEALGECCRHRANPDTNPSTHVIAVPLLLLLLLHDGCIRDTGLRDVRHGVGPDTDLKYKQGFDNDCYQTYDRHPLSGGQSVFQIAEVAIPRQMIQEILRLIAELPLLPPPAPA